MIVVTGAAGFIGANVVRALNQRGMDDILAVDDLRQGDKFRNLAGLAIADYMDKDEFLRQARRDQLPERICALLHQGACADTMAADGQYMLANNFTYSKALYHWCAQRGAQYVYASSASVYGDGVTFIEQPRYEAALNVYAWSKLLFDQYVRRQRRQSPAAADFQCVGLRYFNVYGRGEAHKGNMASVARHFFNQYRGQRQVRLFAGGDGYADGEQRRDFICVEDIAALNLFFLDHPALSGIYNAGTGRSRSFNEVAVAVINACRRRDGEAPTTLAQAVASGEITYIPMPPALRGKYQSYTQADLKNLRATLAAGGHHGTFLDVEPGVERYVAELSSATGA